MKLIIQFSSLFPRVRRIRRMDGRSPAGTHADLIRRAGVITIRQQNSADAKARNLFEICSRRFNRIDAEVSRRVENDVAVEVVTMGLRKPRPSENACQEFSHQLPS